MKKIIILIAIISSLIACEGELGEPVDATQRVATLKIKGYSAPNAVELRFKGEPVLINSQSNYTGNIEKTFEFVLDEGETNTLVIYDFETGNEIRSYDIAYDDPAGPREIHFFNLPDIFLETYAVKPVVNIGKVGFVFLFQNLGEFSGYEAEAVKGVLKRQNGTVLAEFPNIGKEGFSELKVYTYFSATAPVFLELYKPGTTEPYMGTGPIQVQLVQTYGANMIVLQERMENGSLIVKGDIDIADYLN